MGFSLQAQKSPWPFSQKQASYLKFFSFLVSAHLLIIATPFCPTLSLDFSPKAIPSGLSRLPGATPGPLRSFCLPSLHIQRKLGLYKMSSALALSASSSKVKGH